MGSTLNKYSISHPKRKTEKATTTMARVSPKLRRVRLGSKRRVTNPRMLSGGKPNTKAQRRVERLFLFSEYWRSKAIAGCRCEKEVPREPRMVLVAEGMRSSVGSRCLLREV